MMETKRKGKKYFTLVFNSNEKEISQVGNSYPFSFSLFLMTCGLIIGAYVNKILHHR
jgi:hypothetical protein